MSDRFDVAVVGGGAAGLAAAIGAARRGTRTVVCDRMPRLGKKLLITGGGRCNLLNEKISPEVFTSTSPDLVASVFMRFGKERILGFFEKLGLRTFAEEARIFPVTNQAASVLKVLEMEIKRLGIAVETGFEVTGIRTEGESFAIVSGDGRKIRAGTLILAAGGKSYPALGSNGSGFALAEKLGHRIILPVPSAVPLLVKDRMCHLLQGQKIRARAISIVAGKTVETADGEVLFTQYGLSGTAVLDVSESLSVALNREPHRDTAISLDLVPFMAREALAAELRKRIKEGWAVTDLVSGILPEKFAAVIPSFLPPGEKDSAKISSSLASTLKEKRFAVQGTRGWNEAEFTSGGVDAREVDPRTLESRFRKGLYLAGEILDVQSPRGGFNLAWAWASGLLAGQTGN
ncbi:MAG: aminoacetone oxidase family FAD-binding enzyme [Candidatus Aminicenantales bacterium]